MVSKNIEYLNMNLTEKYCEKQIHTVLWMHEVTQLS